MLSFWLVAGFGFQGVFGSRIELVLSSETGL